MASDQRLSDVVVFVEAFLEADEVVLRAALGEPDDDTYLTVLHRASSFYAQVGGVPLGPQAGRWAVPGGRSHQASADPGETGSVLYGVAQLDGERAWLACVGGVHDPEGWSLGAVLLVELVEGQLRVTGRADLDPFVDGIAWAGAGGKDVPLDAPVAETQLLTAPRRPEQAAWLAERFGE